jgi:hypothetical protein
MPDRRHYGGGLFRRVTRHCGGSVAGEPAGNIHSQD